MKKTMLIIFFLFLSLTIFNSCGRVKIVNNGKVNMSIKLPKEMKPMSDEMMRWFLKIPANDLYLNLKEELAARKMKMIGYQWDKNPATTIIIKEGKLSKGEVLASKNLQAFASKKKPGFDYPQLINVKGVDTLFYHDTTKQTYGMFAVKNNKMYDIAAIAAFTDDLNEDEVLDLMMKTTKFGANGIINGVIDGVLFP